MIPAIATDTLCYEFSIKPRCARVDLFDDLLSFSSFLILYYRDFRVILKSIPISILIKSMAQSHPVLGKGVFHVFRTMLCYGAQED